MTTPNAGQLDERIRSWLTSYNKTKLTEETIYGLMNEAANELVQLFDIWFCKVWGSTIRDSDNAVWVTRAIPPPVGSNGAPLTSAEIAAGTIPVNVPYLRALPYPDGLQRPYKAYWNEIQKANELAYLMEDEFEDTYDFLSSGDTPEAYALTGDSIILGKAPAFDATLWVQGYYLPVPLEEDDDENEFTRHGHTLLVYATQNLIIKYNYEEEVRAGLFKEEYGKALRAAIAQSGRTGDNARQSRFVRKG